MPVFLELTVDDFEHNRRPKNYVGGSPRRGAGMSSVRRPLRGIEVKEDTHAVIRILTASGEEIPLVNSSYPDGEGPNFTNFILQSVTDGRAEKSQIIETFGEDFVFFFGEKPRIVQVQSVLINTLDFNWYAEFQENYERYLRGTKCVELGARVYLFYDDIILSGYMMASDSGMDASNNGQVINLSFSMLVFSYDNVSFVGDPNYPVRESADVYVPSVAGLVHAPADLKSLPTWLGVQLPEEYTQDNRYAATPTAPMVINKGLDKTADKQVNTPVRGKISDNVDEWTGDFTSFISKKQIDQILFEEAKSLQDAFIRNSCGGGLLGGNPDTMRSFGLIGPGNGLKGLKDAWSNAKKAATRLASGDFSGAAGALGQTGLVNIKGSSSYTLGFNGSQTSEAAGVGLGYNGTGYGYSQSSVDTPYLSGGGVGYGSNGYYASSGGGAGYYPGAGYFGYGQVGTPGTGSGGVPASVYSTSGKWNGYSPGSNKWESGTFSYEGSVPPPPGFAGSPWGGAYPGGPGSTATTKVASPSSYGYASAQYPAKSASNPYYSNATGCSWSPSNGFQWSSGTTTPAPGQPGGGVFTTQVVPTKGGEVNISLGDLVHDGLVVTTKDYSETSAPSCYGDKELEDVNETDEDSAATII